MINNLKKNVIVTGCAGFVGSHVCERLISEGFNVIGIDDLSTGRKNFLKNVIKNKKFKFLKKDLLKSNLTKYFKNNHIVFHFAANADVRFGFSHPRKDLEQNTIVTFKVLEAMRKNNIKKIIFSSTGSIYGEPRNFPTSENENFPIQTSLYGASKLSAEGLIQAYSFGYSFDVFIFRFVSIFGKRYTHGHLYDFFKLLKKNPNKLKVLGNGNQEKSYMNVSDCVDAIFLAMKKVNKKNKINVYNIGLSQTITVKESIKIMTNYLNLKPKIMYGKSKRGWVGDSPKILLSNKKIKKLGWKPKKSIKQSIHETLDFFVENDWLFKK